MNSAGVCRFCGCSDIRPCPFGCAWTDRTETVCTTCSPAQAAERLMFAALRVAGYRSTRPGIAEVLAFVETFHQGFVVGWFGISSRSPYGRNPYARGREREAWDLGHRSGSEASRQFQRVCGPLENAPRRDVLQVGRRRERRPRRTRARQVTVRGARR